MSQLVLFDIDATLITTGGIGIKAMVDAGVELFGEGFTADGISFAGRLDPLILVEMLALNGQAPSTDNAARMRETYSRRLVHRLVDAPARTLPGVDALLDRLEAQQGVTLGLLTGNFAETGRMKLSACGVRHERFLVQVWGDDSPHHPPARDHLPGVGLARYRERHGTSITGDQVVIIGDTPHDVACARAHGSRSLGVATGRFTVEELTKAGATRAVRDLSDTDDIANWVLAQGR